MLKETAYTIAPVLSALFNKLILSQIGTVPDSWKLSLITPVPKHGKLSDPNNYCPISLLPIVSKVLEHIIFNKLCDHLSITDHQKGFLPGRSTTDTILSAIQEWHRKPLIVSFIDYFFKSSSNSTYIPHCCLDYQLSSSCWSRRGKIFISLQYRMATKI